AAIPDPQGEREWPLLQCLDAADPGPTVAGGAGRALVGGVGGRWDLPLRPVTDPGRDLLDRHPTPNSERLPPRWPRALLHPHGRGGPLSTDARPRGLLSDGLGRQRPADRAPGAELLRRPVRSPPTVRPGLRCTREAGKRRRSHLATQLLGVVRSSGRRGRKG